MIKKEKERLFAVIVKLTGEIIYVTNDFIECITKLENCTKNYKIDTHDIVDLIELDNIISKYQVCESLGKLELGYIS